MDKRHPTFLVKVGGVYRLTDGSIVRVRFIRTADSIDVYPMESWQGSQTEGLPFSRFKCPVEQQTSWVDSEPDLHL